MVFRLLYQKKLTSCAIGLDTEGIFRRSPNSAMMHQMREAYDRGQPVSLPYFDDPHLAAVLLKKFFHDLPDPIFPESTYSTIQACPLPSNDPSQTACIDYIREIVIPLLDKISPPALIVLSYVLREYIRLSCPAADLN
jgi:Rho GTPase-activating protein 1